MDFDINQRMSVSLSPNFTTVKIVLPKIKPLDQEELIISTEWLEKNHVKTAATCLAIIHFGTKKTVTKPNGSSHSLGGTSEEVLKKRKAQPT